MLAAIERGLGSALGYGFAAVVGWAMPRASRGGRRRRAWRERYRAWSMRHNPPSREYPGNA